MGSGSDGWQRPSTYWIEHMGIGLGIYTKMKGALNKKTFFV